MSRIRASCGRRERKERLHSWLRFLLGSILGSLERRFVNTSCHCYYKTRARVGCACAHRLAVHGGRHGGSDSQVLLHLSLRQDVCNRSTTRTRLCSCASGDACTYLILKVESSSCVHNICYPATPLMRKKQGVFQGVLEQGSRLPHPSPPPPSRTFSETFRPTILPRDFSAIPPPTSPSLLALCLQPAGPCTCQKSWGQRI